MSFKKFLIKITFPISLLQYQRFAKLLFTNMLRNLLFDFAERYL
jgi:hypothetical protein